MYYRITVFLLLQHLQWISTINTITFHTNGVWSEQTFTPPCSMLISIWQHNDIKWISQQRRSCYFMWKPENTVQFLVSVAAQRHNSRHGSEESAMRCSYCHLSWQRSPFLPLLPFSILGSLPPPRFSQNKCWKIRPPQTAQQQICTLPGFILQRISAFSRDGSWKQRWGTGCNHPPNIPI